MKLSDFCKKYMDGWEELAEEGFLELKVNKKYVYEVSIHFNDQAPYYHIQMEGCYILIGELNEFKNQVEEAYNLLKSYHNFLCELKLDEELTEEQEAILESIVHALA